MTAAPAAVRLLLPRWVYTPGGALPPDSAALERAKALVPPRFVLHVPAGQPALGYGLALNDAGFFWEAHEILEAVWRAAPPGGRDRILLRACIQIANAGLKRRLGRSRAAARLVNEAIAELDELAVRPGAARGGFADVYPVAKLRQKLGDAAVASPAESGWIALEPPGGHMQENAGL